MSVTTLNSYTLDTLPMSAYPGAALAIPLRDSSRRIGRRILVSLVAAVSLLAFAFLSFFATISWAFAHPAVAELASNPMQARHLAYADVSFPSDDGLTNVHGWWIPAAVPSERTVVLSHGYGTNREESWVPMYDIAALVHGLSFNVLMFDYGYADAANRSPATGGVNETGQLIGALQFARSQGSRENVVWGFSMGAGTALQAALRTDLIDAMILDSAFIADADSIYYNLRQYISLPKHLSIEVLRRMLPMFTGTRLAEIPSAKAQSTDFPFPVLVIHGTADDKAPASISENVAAAQTNPLSGLWTVPGAIHEMIFRTHPDEYAKRTTGFLEAALGFEPPAVA